MDGLEAAGHVLSFCAQQDPYAGQYLKTTNIFKNLLKTQGLSNSQQSQSPSVRWSDSRPERSLGSGSLTSASSHEITPSEAPTNSTFTPSTVSSSFDSTAYPTPGSFSVSSLFYAQYTLSQHFESQLDQTGSQLDAYPTTFKWTPSNTVGPHPASDSRRNQFEESSDPTKHHHQPFLQDYYNLQ